MGTTWGVDVSRVMSGYVLICVSLSWELLERIGLCCVWCIRVDGSCSCSEMQARAGAATVRLHDYSFSSTLDFDIDSLEFSF